MEMKKINLAGCAPSATMRAQLHVQLDDGSMLQYK